MELSLLLENNSTGHNDLVLRFAGNSWQCDTYYLVLDGESLPGPNDTAKIRRILQKILEQWLYAVENVPDGSTVYLPYDFSDEYTAWLRCSRMGDTASVCRGWAEEEGWKISPSSVGHYLTHLPGFRPDGPTVDVSMRELIEAVRNLTANDNRMKHDV
jgi:hypothetical protein